MKYIMNLIKTLIPIFIFYITSYMIIFISSFIYSINNNNLEVFINTYLPYILILYYILVIIYIKNKYKYPNKKANRYNSYLSLYLGLSLSALLNMLIFLIKPPSKEITVSLLTSLLSSAIIGPILEEYIFRYYLYNKLIEFNSKKKTIILNSLIFGILHGSLLNIIYAFILGLFINIIYNKYKNIYYCILIHIGANLMGLLLTTYNQTILILSIINLLLYAILIQKNKLKRATLHL